MKVLIINTSDCLGGAAVAANRLTSSLRNAGIEARMLVLNQGCEADYVLSLGKSWQKKIAFVCERLTIWTYNLFSRKNLFTVSIANTGFDVTRHPAFIEADVIHLQWINQGLLSLQGIAKILRSGKPVVWTMHDMWECTGICHHAYECHAFTSICHNCPFLRFPGRHDLSQQIYIKKQHLLNQRNVHFVAVSNWLAHQARISALIGKYPISVIPNALSLADFQMFDRNESRKICGLPDKYILLFGAARIDDPIKGFSLLLQAIRLLIKQNRFMTDELHLVFFGKIKHPDQVLPEIPISYTDAGWINDVALLSRFYSAADTLVSASLYETFGQTLIEAQACGCLPVSFGNSGQADIIRHKENGYISEYKSVQSLADGIYWNIMRGSNTIDRNGIRETVLTRYAGNIVAEQYIKLYKELIDKGQ